MADEDVRLRDCSSGQGNNRNSLFSSVEAFDDTRRRVTEIKLVPSALRTSGSAREFGVQGSLLDRNGPQQLQL